jgi:hypothetical protein
VIVSTRKTVDESFSFEKLVMGANSEIVASCTSEKSAMTFWRSRMFLKKSFDVSDAGLIVFAGASAGPWYE